MSPGIIFLISVVCTVLGILFGWLAGGYYYHRNTTVEKNKRLIRIRDRRLRARQRFYNEISENLEELQTQLSRSAVDKQLAAPQFHQNVYSRYLPHIRDIELRHTINSLYVHFFVDMSLMQYISEFFEKNVEKNPVIPDDKREELKLTIVKDQIHQLEDLAKHAEEVREKIRDHGI